MSESLILTEDERLQWLNMILSICDSCRLSINRSVAAYLIIQLYEFMVACSGRKENEPVKLKQLQLYYVDDDKIKFAILSLYKLRGLLTHNPVNSNLQNAVNELLGVIGYLSVPIRKFFGEVNEEVVLSAIKHGLCYLQYINSNSDDDLMNELRDMCK